MITRKFVKSLAKQRGIKIASNVIDLILDSMKITAGDAVKDMKDLATSYGKKTITLKEAEFVLNVSKEEKELEI